MVMFRGEIKRVICGDSAQTAKIQQEIKTLNYAEELSGDILVCKPYSFLLIAEICLHNDTSVQTIYKIVNNLSSAYIFFYIFRLEESRNLERC